MTIQNYFLNLLKVNNNNTATISKLSHKDAKKLIQRIDSIKLHAHSYAFYLNFQHSDFNIIDLLDFAFINGLSGIDIHIESGNEKSLTNKSEKELKDIKKYAKKLNLTIHLELNSTQKDDINTIVKIAKILEVQSIRTYIMYPGKLSEILKQGISDLKYIAHVAKKNNLFFVLECHEVEKSFELVNIISEVNSPHVNLLFDFGNMINANEKPMDALKIMSPFIKHVHLKGSCFQKKHGGFGHIGVKQGKDDLPQMAMLFHLLMLGESKSQVEVFALEQEVGYHSPPFRFDNEKEDPIIPKRETSSTILEKNVDISKILITEKQNAQDQIIYIKTLLTQLKTISELTLEE